MEKWSQIVHKTLLGVQGVSGVYGVCDPLITAHKRSLRRLCFYTRLSVHGGGGWYPSMPCRWYPSMPCRSPGWGVCIPECLAWFQAQTQGEFEGSGLGGSPGQHPGGSGSHLGGRGLQAHTKRGCVYPSMH